MFQGTEYLSQWLGLIPANIWKIGWLFYGGYGSCRNVSAEVLILLNTQSALNKHRVTAAVCKIITLNYKHTAQLSCAGRSKFTEIHTSPTETSRILIVEGLLSIVNKQKLNAARAVIHEHLQVLA